MAPPESAATSVLLSPRVLVVPPTSLPPISIVVEALFCCRKLVPEGALTDPAPPLKAIESAVMVTPPKLLETGAVAVIDPPVTETPDGAERAALMLPGCPEPRTTLRQPRL